MALDTPRCYGMQEIPEAAVERAKVSDLLLSQSTELTPLFIHLSHGLALTTGSALGSKPPTIDACLAAFTVPNTAGLTAGARAWSKHFHRSRSSKDEASSTKREVSEGWWGSPSGPVSGINEKAVALFWKIMDDATWRNLHWLPHQVLVYEVRVVEGYGMRWSRDEKNCDENDDQAVQGLPWAFCGFLEPQMENGHEIGWRH